MHCIYQLHYINNCATNYWIHVVKVPYNSSPLASTDVIAKFARLHAMFTHFANSTGLSGQCSKGPQDSLQEISWGELSHYRGQANLQGGRVRVNGLKGVIFKLASNNLAPYPVPMKCSKPHKHDPERSIWLLFATFSIITVIMGVSNDAKLFWQFKWSKQLQSKVQ